MPILLPHSITALSEQAFHTLDYDVMALAFEVHNELGRFYDESIYQNALLEKCRRKGLKTDHELEIRLTHNDYQKPLFIDLIIEGSVYELKTIRSIQEQQRLQTLNYLFTTNTQHGKLINFQPASVEHEFISTTLNQASRQNFSIQNALWHNSSQEAEKLMTLMLNLLNDWGAFFDTYIYEEALIHLLGGKEKIVTPVEIRNQKQLLGMQKLNVLSEREFFIITAVRNGIHHYQTHLNKLLKHTTFQQLHWINLNHAEVQFTTLEQ